MMIAKTLAVLAAMLLVAAVALGTLMPADLSLGEALDAVARLQLSATEAFVRAHVSAWLWDRPLRALLVRPTWMLPAAAGLISAGAAMTAASRQKAAPSRRRQS